MKVLLVKPYPELRAPRLLQEKFIHLEPLELEIVAGGVPPEDEPFILDLGLEKIRFRLSVTLLPGFLPIWSDLQPTAPM